MVGYKWQSSDAIYAPCNPHPSLGRFGDGTAKTVYVAESGRGAMAEFFRRSPELFDFQDDLVIVLYELDLEIAGNCLDVRDEASRQTVGIPLDRLTSSELDESTRYGECRQLAQDVASQRLWGILYPSAAATWADAWNMVLFGDQSPVGWECRDHRELARPRLKSADVSPLP